MAGGGGDDSYVIDTGYDAVIEAPGGGVDTVIGGVNYTLTANVENLRLEGDAYWAIEERAGQRPSAATPGGLDRG